MRQSEVLREFGIVLWRHFIWHYIHRKINGKTQKRTHHICAHYSERRVLFRTPSPIFLRKSNGDVSPHGQCNSKPNGYSVKGLTEYRMEIYEYGPGVRVFVDLRPNFDVHMECKRYIFQHDEEISDGKAGEYGVGGTDHFSAAEDSNVDRVGSGADDADDNGDVAVQPAVRPIEVGGAGHAVRVGRVRHPDARAPLKRSCVLSSAPYAPTSYLLPALYRIHSSLPVTNNMYSIVFV